MEDEMTTERFKRAYNKLPHVIENKRNRTCIDGIHGKCERERNKQCRNCPFYEDVVEVKLLGTQKMLTRILESNISLNKQQTDAIEEALDKFKVHVRC